MGGVKGKRGGSAYIHKVFCELRQPAAPSCRTCLAVLGKPARTAVIVLAGQYSLHVFNSFAL